MAGTQAARRHGEETAMRSKLLIAAALALAAFGATAWAAGAPVVHAPPVTNPEWEKPFPAFKIVGNLYYVGTYDLGCYLISTSDGLILINSGVASSVPMIKKSVESLGFKFSDIKIITSTHGHRDHVGGLAEIKRMTGAKMYMNARDVATLESGGDIDFVHPHRGVIYEPIKVDVATYDGDKITLGDIVLTVHNSPGHTPGATSFTLPVSDGGKTYNVLIANMPGINQGVKLLGTPNLPGLADDFRSTIAALGKMTPDIWVSSHAGQFNLHEVYKPGDPYNPARFGDLAAYRAKIAGYKKAYEDQLAEESASIGR
jgi:metallo-beta-lactamase class B